MNKKEHGGNIYKLAKRLGVSEEKILDFSANINPVGMAPAIREAMIQALDGTVNYPDPDCTDLREAIARDTGADPAWITCGNGGADLLYRIAYGLSPKNVLLPVPSFSEYEEAMRAARAGIDYYRMGDDLRIHPDILNRITGETDLVIVCNPNNPTGLLTGREPIRDILSKAKQVGARVLLDECFLEICTQEADYSLIPEIGAWENLIVLKSFTKLYAIPGVRLGYVLCSNPAVNEKIALAGQAWPVSHIAQKAGVAALAAKDYKKRVIGETAEELAFMKEKMAEMPVRLYDGAANYLFFQTEGFRDLDRRLAARGILIRNCGNYENLPEGSWRVAVKSHRENERLLGALRNVFFEGRECV